MAVSMTTSFASNIIANAQAEYIIQHFHIHKDFKVLTGYCFAGIKGRIGATFARALAFRALSCTKDGRRRHDNASTPTDLGIKHPISASTCLHSPTLTLQLLLPVPDLLAM